MVCLAASAGSVATSEQSFQIAGSPVTVAGQVLAAAKLPLPANSKIVTLNMPTTQGGREHEGHPFPLGLCQKWMEECHVESVGAEHGRSHQSLFLLFFFFVNIGWKSFNDQKLDFCLS